MSETFDVCVVGSANLDLVATTERLPGPGETVLGSSYAEHAGGKGLNQAVAAARAGAIVSFCGAIGGDAAGTHLRSVVTNASIDDRWLLQRDDVPTGRALIGVSASGENSIIVVAGANAELTPNDVTRAATAARVVMAQLEVPVATVFEALRSGRAAGAITLLNPAPAPDARLPPDLLALCDVVIPNEHEVELLGGVAELFRLGAKAVVVTLGSKGAKLCTPDADDVIVASFAVDAIDTTAAGDAFCGGFATALSSGSSYIDAMRFAAATGALATTRHGAVPSLPSRAEIDELLTRGG